MKRHHTAFRGYSSPTDPAKDAELVVDGSNGHVLYARNATLARHPASLTKMMTLYLLFDALKKGKITMQTPMTVSAHAASQHPVKLYFHPGDTIPVESAIKAIVVISANDVAVTIAEALGGTESHFAQMMTAKARELGMTHTYYDNASGLPDPLQITTAQDLSIMARHLEYDFPQYFHYFSTVSFTWRGIPHITTDDLIGKYEGADGIKTGYTGGSGFNLVSDVVRNKQHVIGVVMGGYTARARDREMMRLLDQTYAKIDANPTLVARATVPWQTLAQNPASAPVTASFAVASTTSPAKQGVKTASAQQRWTLFGSLARNRPPAPPYPGQEAPAAKTLVAVAFAAPHQQQTAPAITAPKPEQRVAAYQPRAIPAVQPVPRDEQGEGDIGQDSNVAATATFGPRSWEIQIGAYADPKLAQAALASYEDRSEDVLKHAQKLVVPLEAKNGHVLYRARFGPFAERDARDVCAKLTERGQTCFAASAAMQ